MRLISRRSFPVIAGTALAVGATTGGFTALPATAAGSVPFGTTWVADHGSDTVTGYAPDASGNATPVATIKGGRTGLANPTSVAVDSAGDVFVTNFAANSITEYAPGATGNVSPLATISGAATGLNGPSGLAVLGTDLWVSNSNSNVLEKFATTTNGNAIPFASIYGSRTGLDTPTALALGPNGAGLWVVNNPLGGPAAVSEFDPADSGNVLPLSVISGSKTQLVNPSSVAADIHNHPWVTIPGTDSVSVFTSAGNHAPARTLAGSKTGLDQPSAIGFDAIGRPTIGNLGDASLRVFGHKASGDTAPLRVISGSGTGLAAPTGVNLYAAVPGTPRGLTVHPGAGRLHVSWNRPSSTGGGVVSYLVLIGGRAPITTTATSYTRRHLKNGHRYQVQVAAMNQRGLGRLSQAVSATPAATPGMPRHLAVTPTRGALAVTWKAPKSNGGRAITRYRIQFATCSIGARGCVAPSVKVGGKTRSVTLHDVAPGHRYHVRVTPRNALGYGKPAEATATA